jgi:hypothetical protein
MFFEPRPRTLGDIEMLGWEIPPNRRGNQGADLFDASQ